MAKFPRDGVPVTGRGIGASAVRVANSTGVTAVGHTTYPTGPGGASEESCTAATLGWAKSEQLDSAVAARARATRYGHTRALLEDGITAIAGADPSDAHSDRCGPGVRPRRSLCASLGSA